MSIFSYLLFLRKLEQLILEVMETLNTTYSLDTFINNKLKFGYAQKKLIVPLSLLLFSEGSQSIVLGILLPIFVTEWGITDTQKSTLISVVYLGVSLGSLLQTLADKYGRYKLMTISGIIQVISNIWSCFAGNYLLFTVLRIFFGVGLGIIGPLSVTYITQITPSDTRGFLVTLSRVFWSSGMIFTALVSFILKDDWRLILFIISLPSILGLYFQISDGCESPRYLLFDQQYEKARKLLDKMSEMNKTQHITQSEYQQLQQWAKQNKEKNQSSIGYKQLFLGDNCVKTIKIIYLWFAVNFIYYGGMLLLPLILNNDKTNKSLNYIIILISSIFEVFLLFAAKILMDSPSFGRRNTILLGFLSSTLLSVLLMFQLNKILFSVCFVFMRLFGGLAFITLYPYTAQSYHTLSRSKILGLGSLIGRFGVILVGWVGVYAMHIWEGSFLYFVFMGVSALGLIIMNTLKWDTLGNDLDIVYH